MIKGHDIWAILVKLIAIIMFFIGLIILLSVGFSYGNNYKEVPYERLFPSRAIKNYELNLQTNISFFISIIVDIPAESNEGNLSLYMDKDYQSDLFNREKEKIETLVVKGSDGVYYTYIRNSSEFNDFFYNDISIDLPIEYIPGYDYYPLIFILYNGSYHTFLMDEPVHITQKIIVNKNEIYQAKEDNTRLTNTAF